MGALHKEQRRGDTTIKNRFGTPGSKLAAYLPRRVTVNLMLYRRGTFIFEIAVALFIAGISMTLVVAHTNNSPSRAYKHIAQSQIDAVLDSALMIVENTNNPMVTLEQLTPYIKDIELVEPDTTPSSGQVSVATHNWGIVAAAMTPDGVCVATKQQYVSQPDNNPETVGNLFVNITAPNATDCAATTIEKLSPPVPLQSPLGESWQTPWVFKSCADAGGNPPTQNVCV